MKSNTRYQLPSGLFFENEHIAYIYVYGNCVTTFGGIP